MVAWGHFGESIASAQAVMMGIAGEQIGWFESWAFQGQSESAIRKRFRGQVESELTQIRKACELSDGQVDKLRLSAEGDISRFFRMVEKAKKNTENMQPDQAHVQDIQKHLAPIQERMSNGLFDQKSLFRQVLASTLSPDQLAEMERLNDIRTHRSAEAAARVTLSRLQLIVPMMAEQRETYLQLMVEELKKHRVPRRLQMYASEYLCFQMPEEKLKPFLDEHQIAAIKKNSANAIAMKQFLEQQGIKLP